MLQIFHLLGNNRATGGIYHAVCRLAAYKEEDVLHTLVVNKRFRHRSSDAMLGVPFFKSDANAFPLLLSVLLAFPMVYWRIRRTDDTILHGHSRGGILLGMLLHAATGLPLVVTHHAYCQQRKFYMKGLGRPHVRYVFLTSMMRDYYGVAGDDATTGIIPSPCPDDYYELAHQRLERRAGGAPLRFVGLGKICSQKGWDLLIDALKQMKHMSRSHLRFDIYGDMSDAAYCRDLRRRIVAGNLCEIVHVHPETDHIKSLLMDSDWMICPSRREGLGLAAIEAMASGIPVVASDCDGFRSFVQPDVNGFLFENGNVDSLVQVLSRIADHACTMPSPASISDHVSSYAVSRIVPRYLDLYRHLWRSSNDGTT